jgi:hypothetical protein
MFVIDTVHGVDKAREVSRLRGDLLKIFTAAGAGAAAAFTYGRLRVAQRELAISEDEALTARVAQSVEQLAD